MPQLEPKPAAFSYSGPSTITFWPLYGPVWISNHQLLYCTTCYILSSIRPEYSGWNWFSRQMNRSSRHQDDFRICSYERKQIMIVHYLHQMAVPTCLIWHCLASSSRISLLNLRPLSIIGLKITTLFRFPLTPGILQTIAFISCYGKLYLYLPSLPASVWLSFFWDHKSWS